MVLGKDPFCDLGLVKKISRAGLGQGPLLPAEGKDPFWGLETLGNICRRSRARTPSGVLRRLKTFVVGPGQGPLLRYGNTLKHLSPVPGKDPFCPPRARTPSVILRHFEIQRRSRARTPSANPGQGPLLLPGTCKIFKSRSWARTPSACPGQGPLLLPGTCKKFHETVLGKDPFCYLGLVKKIQEPVQGKDPFWRKAL
jgi:hypothetical protein